MKLKEKIQTIIIDDYGNLQKILLLENIADEYNVEFVEWLVTFGVRTTNGNWIINLDFGALTTKEALEMFKKEKGW